MLFTMFLCERESYVYCVSGVPYCREPEIPRLWEPGISLPELRIPLEQMQGSLPGSLTGLLPGFPLGYDDPSLFAFLVSAKRSFA